MESIAAISTPAGAGGIAVVRLSGDDALQIADRVWRGAPLSRAASHTAHLGEIIDADGGMLDQAVATVFHAGKSFTGEPTVEFSIHGSPWIQREVVSRLISAGASAAGAGEFTRRAFINGRIDLAQAEGIADMIAASSKAAQRLASTQMKGKFSERLNHLRDNMINLSSLLELELDFSEEDVEFADRNQLQTICKETLAEVARLAGSFRAGKAIKEGVSVVIAGVPNAGKSTLLNLLLEEEKAIVSDIPGTTRDIIEDTAEINGVLYRFIDTAGLRESHDEIERIGIERARNRVSRANVLIWIYDRTTPSAPQRAELQALLPLLPSDTPIIILHNKSDLIASDSISCVNASSATISALNLKSAEAASNPELQPDANMVEGSKPGLQPDAPTIQGSTTVIQPDAPTIQGSATIIQPDATTIQGPTTVIQPDGINAENIVISAKEGRGIEELKAALQRAAGIRETETAAMMVTNARHYESLTKAGDALTRVQEGITTGLSGDLIAQDLREAIHHIGLITGTITTDTLLHSIFTRFCIGK